MTLYESYMDLVQMLYDYKQTPYLFFFHLLTIGLLGTFIFFLLMKRSFLKSIENNPQKQPSKCHDHMKYIDYIREKKRTTESEVQKLQSSKQYQKYLIEKNDPTSKYNRQIQVEQIVFSDEQQNEMDRARNERKNKTT